MINLNLNKKPFGIRFEGNTVCIKLRFTKDRFLKADIAEYGSHFTTKSGHIIFEAEYVAPSKSLAELQNKLDVLRNQPTK
jgi:hypothetical protein